MSYHLTEFEHPADADFQDWIDLSHRRSWMMLWDDPKTVEDIPRIWLEQYPEGFDLEHDISDANVTGHVWLYPEDIPAVIANLQSWLHSFRECARADAKRRPPPNWGGLLSTPQRPWEEQRSWGWGREIDLDMLRRALWLDCSAIGSTQFTVSAHDAAADALSILVTFDPQRPIEAPPCVCTAWRHGELCEHVLCVLLFVGDREVVHALRRLVPPAETACGLDAVGDRRGAVPAVWGGRRGVLLVAPRKLLGAARALPAAGG